MKQPYEAIYIGNDWSLELQFSEFDSQRKIESSATGVVTTIGEHDFANNDRVYVANHLSTGGILSSLNGSWVAASVGATVVTLTGATSNGTGSETGFISRATNHTAATITAQIRDYAGEGSPLIATPTITRTDLDGIVVLSLTDTQTIAATFLARQGKKCYVEVKRRDSSGFDETIYTKDLIILARVVQ